MKKPTYEELENRIKCFEKSEKLLKGHKALLDLTVESAPIGITTIYRDGRFRTVNTSFCKMIGYSAEELLRMTIRDITHPDYIKQDAENLSKLWNGDISVYHCEKKYIRKDKIEIVGIIRAGLVRDDDDKPLFIVGGLEDITERKQMLKKIHQSEQKLDLMINSAPDIIYHLDSEGKFIFVNSAIESLGYSPGELLGTSILDIVHPDDRDAAVYRINERRSGDRGIRRYEVKLLRKGKGTACFEDQSLGIEDPVYLVDANGYYDIDSEESKGFLGTLGVARDITERKKIEDELREKEENIRLLMDSTVEGIYGLNLQGICTFANRACARILGYDDTSQLIGKNMHNLIHHTRKDGAPYPDSQCRIYQAFREGKSTNVDDEVLWRSDGTSFHSEYWSHPIWKDGKVIGSVVSIVDITERKKAEQALKESEERFRVIFEKAPIGIAQIGSNLKFIKVNEAYCKMLGYKKEELLEKSFADFTHPDDIQRGIKKGRELFDQKPPRIQIEKRYITKDKRAIWCRVSAVILDEKNGIPENSIAIIEDITARKKAEEERRESQEKYRKLVENLEDTYFFYTHDLNGNFTYVSPSITNILGYPQDEFLTHYAEYQTDNPINEDVKLRTGLAIKGIKQPTFEVEIFHKNNNIVSLDVTEIPVFDSEGKVISVEGIAHDITKRRTTEKERQSLEQQLFQSQKMESIGRLAGGIAHDFNNILTSIMTCSEILKMRYTDAGSQEERAADIIIEGTKRAANLTRQLLGFARGGRYNPVPVNINAVIRSTVKVSGNIFEKNVQVIYDLEDDIHIIKADENQMDQVFTNLIINASDAMPDGGQITLKTKNVELSDGDIRNKNYGLISGRHVKISVTDSGTGIPKKIIHKIFEPFFTTKSQGKGTGLGLATVFGIIKNHGGEIEVQSKPGEGSTFVLYFPVSGKEIVKKTDSAHAIKRGNETILIVDDEEEIRESCKMQLEGIGYKILLAEDGVEAVNIYKKQKDEIDLVLLDMLMPNMAGRETYRALHKINKDVKAVIFSGFSKDYRAQEILEEGAKAFIQKPFKLRELSSILKDVLL